MKRGKNGALLINERCETTVSHIWAAGDCSWIDREGGIDDVTHNWLQMQLWSQAKAMGTLAAQCMVSCNDIEACELFAGIHFELFAHTTHFFGYKVVLLGRFNGQGIMKPGVDTSVNEIVNEGDSNGEHSFNGCRDGGKDGSRHKGSNMKGTQVHGTREDTKANEKIEKSLHTDNATTDYKDRTDKHVEIWTRITPGQEYIKLTVVSGRVVGALLIGDTDLEEMLENLILNKLDVSRLGIGLLDPDVDIEDYFD